MDERQISEILDQGTRGSYRGMRLDYARLTQAQLAERSGVSRPSVQAFESGRGVSDEVKDRVRRALAEAIQEREEEENLLATIGMTSWSTVESYVQEIRGKIDAGELDPDTGVTALFCLLDRMRGRAEASPGRR